MAKIPGIPRNPKKKSPKLQKGESDFPKTVQSLRRSFPSKSANKPEPNIFSKLIIPGKIGESPEKKQIRVEFYSLPQKILSLPPIQALLNCIDRVLPNSETTLKDVLVLETHLDGNETCGEIHQLTFSVKPFLEFKSNLDSFGIIEFEPPLNYSINPEKGLCTIHFKSSSQQTLEVKNLSNTKEEFES